MDLNSTLQHKLNRAMILRLILTIIFFVYAGGCATNSNGNSNSEANFEETIQFVGKDYHQLCDLTSKWGKENLKVDNINIDDGENQTGTINIPLDEKKLVIELSIADESVTIRFNQDPKVKIKISAQEMKTIVEDYRGFINKFSSNGIWERPRDY